MRHAEKFRRHFCRRMFSVRSSFSQNVLSCMSLYQAQIVTSFAYVNKPLQVTANVLLSLGAVRSSRGERILRRGEPSTAKVNTLGS